ncbi:MAG: YigZ family protein [Campylobacter sp.]|nr:YigZ family protein [Campylobacter sp.]
MYSVSDTITTSQEIKKSNFIACLTPYSKFNQTHETLKENHPKAVHIVWAYRHLNKYLQIVEDQSDDGEPKGTSGPPALSALRGADLINAGVFIVRYFGGVKLGTGGLVRAYSSSVNLTINKALSENLVLPFEIKDLCKLNIPFALISRFEYFFEKNNLEYEKEFNTSGMSCEISLKQEEFSEFYNFYKPFLVDSVEILALPLYAKKIVK